MGEPRTYFILQSTDYKINQLIRLGQLISNPRIPYRSLASPLQSVPSVPTIYSSSKINWQLSKSRGASTELSIFAQFLNVASARLSGHASKELTQTWEAAELETHFIELGEDVTYAKESVAVKQVQDWLKENKRFGKTVYMITGIKVARQPGPATYYDTRETGGSAEAGGDPGTGGAVEVGAGGSFDRSTALSEESQPKADFVFAYRLRKVRVSWRNKIKLRNDVVGADLHGVGSRQDDSDSSDEDSGKSSKRDTAPKVPPAAVEDEIEDVFLAKIDFGSSLPAGDMKMKALDEDDGKGCLVVVAAE